MASLGRSPSCKIFSWKNRQIICIWFLVLVIRILLVKFDKKFLALVALGSYFHVTFPQQRVNKNWRVSRFLEHVSFSFYFFSWNLYISKILSTSCGQNQLIISTEVILETKLKISIFAIFWHYFTFFKLSVLPLTSIWPTTIILL